MVTQKQEFKRDRFLILLGAIMMQVCIGAIYSWTLFNEALHDEFKWEIRDIIFTYSLIIFTFALTTMVSGRLLDKYGAKKIGSIGGFLYGLGLILSSRATTLPELYLYYGIIAGIGVGFTYVCPLTTCIKWFPEKKGLVTGIVIGAFGIGSLIFKGVIETFLRDYGVSQTFFNIGIIYLILTIIGARLLKEPKEITTPESKTQIKGNIFTVRTMLKTKNFYFIWISYLFACVGGLLIIGSAVEIGLEVAKVTMAQATAAVAIIAIFNGSGRFFWGIISDKIGGKKSAIIMFIITTLSMLFIGLIQLSLVSFYIVIAITTFCFGGFLVIYPTITSEYFGMINLGRNYGIVYQAYGAAALIGPILLKNSTNYTTPFLIAGVATFIGAFFINQIKK